MFSVMTWNLENFERPAANAAQAVKDQYTHKLDRISELIKGAEPDLVGVQEVLAERKNLTPPAFDDLRAALGAEWSGCLSQRPDPRGIRVGWLARGQLSDPTDVFVYPHQVPPTTIDDNGNQITAITAAKRGALAVTYTRGDGLEVRALTAHLKSKLLSFPGHDPQHPQFDTRDEAVRARFGLYALNQRAAEAATIRAWATDQLQGHGQERHVLVCGDLNDTPQAATTQLLLGRPGSQLGTGGFAQPDWGDGNRLWDLAPKMPAGDPVTGEGAANWSRINNGVRELIDQILVSHLLVHALESTESLPLEGIKSVTADPASLADMEAPSDHRPVIARFNL
jgi:endonuclease/exonuclease/phosphatase family metal-dependent hydrolase